MSNRVNVTPHIEMEGRNITIEIDGLDSVARALGDLQGRSPQAVKVAVNQTARQARKLMIAATKARYAVNEAGMRNVKKLKQTKRATNSDLTAKLYIKTPRNDLGYYQTNPPYPTYFVGGEWRRGPNVWTGRVLRSSGMEELTGKGNKAKAFLAKFKSGHVGMVQRVVGSSSDETKTKSGAPRWRNRWGRVEKLVTLGSPSAAATHKVVWPDVREDVELYLMARIQDRVDWILARYK